MTTCNYVARGGRIATASGSFDGDIGIVGRTIVALGQGFRRGRREIDAQGRLVLSGEIDAQFHIEQMTAAGFRNADTFHSETESALLGGGTTVIPFESQPTPLLRDC